MSRIRVEFHPFVCDPVNVRALVKCAPFVAEITPAEVVCEEKNNIRPIIIFASRNLIWCKDVVSQHRENKEDCDFS